MCEFSTNKTRAPDDGKLENHEISSNNNDKQNMAKSAVFLTFKPIWNCQHHDVQAKRSIDQWIQACATSITELVRTVRTLYE